MLYCSCSCIFQWPTRKTFFIASRNFLIPSCAILNGPAFPRIHTDAHTPTNNQTKHQPTISRGRRRKKSCIGIQHDRRQSLLLELNNNLHSHIFYLVKLYFVSFANCFWSVFFLFLFIFLLFFRWSDNSPFLSCRNLQRAHIYTVCRWSVASVAHTTTKTTAKYAKSPMDKKKCNAQIEYENLISFSNNVIDGIK